jgi:hypothetical protein
MALHMRREAPTVTRSDHLFCARRNPAHIQFCPALNRKNLRPDTQAHNRRLCAGSGANSFAPWSTGAAQNTLLGHKFILRRNRDAVGLIGWSTLSTSTGHPRVTMGGRCLEHDCITERRVQQIIAGRAHEPDTCEHYHACLNAAADNNKLTVCWPERRAVMGCGDSEPGRS